MTKVIRSFDFEMTQIHCLLLSKSRHSFLVNDRVFNTCNTTDGYHKWNRKFLPFRCSWVHSRVLCRSCWFIFVVLWTILSLFVFQSFDHYIFRLSSIYGFWLFCDLYFNFIFSKFIAIITAYYCFVTWEVI